MALEIQSSLETPYSIRFASHALQMAMDGMPIIVYIIELLLCFEWTQGGSVFAPRQRFHDTQVLDASVADFFDQNNYVVSGVGMPGNCNLSTQLAPNGSTWQSLAIVDEPRVVLNSSWPGISYSYHLYADRARPTIMFSDSATENLARRGAHSTLWYMYPRRGAPGSSSDVDLPANISNEPGWFMNFRPHYADPFTLHTSSTGLECVEDPEIEPSSSYTQLEGVHTAFPAPRLSPHLSNADILICDKLDRFVVITTNFNNYLRNYNRVHIMKNIGDRSFVKNGDWGIQSPDEVITALPTGHSPRQCLTADVGAVEGDEADDDDDSGTGRKHHVVLVGTDGGQQIEDWVPQHATWTFTITSPFNFGDPAGITSFERGRADPIFRVEGGDLRHAVFVDLDEDGDLDLLVAARSNPQEDSDHVLVIEATVDDNDAERNVYDVVATLSSERFAGTSFVVATDVDGDGLLDVVALGDGQVIWFQRKEELSSFYDPVTISAVSDIVNDYGLVAADLDGDGDDDLVVSRGAGGTTVVYENVFSQTGDYQNPFLPAHFLPIGEDIPLGTDRAVRVGDMDGDGDNDVVVTSDGPDIDSWGVYYYENQGLATPSPTVAPSGPSPMPTSWPTGPSPMPTASPTVGPTVVRSPTAIPTRSPATNAGGEIERTPAPVKAVSTEGDNIVNNTLGASTWWILLIFMFTTTCLLCIMVRVIWKRYCSRKRNTTATADTTTDTAAHRRQRSDEDGYSSAESGEHSKVDGRTHVEDPDTLTSMPDASTTNLYAPQSRPRGHSQQSSAYSEACLSDGSQNDILGRHGNTRHDDEVSRGSESDSWVSDDEACALERRKLSKRQMETLAKQPTITTDIKVVGVVDRINNFFFGEP